MTAADLAKLPRTADRAAREQYLRAHAAAIYEHLTDGRRLFLRVDELCRRAAEAFPGVVPSQEELADEAPRLQRDKRGVEVDQGLFLAQVLADPACGLHLCHAMLLPRTASREKLKDFEEHGELDLGGARVHREGAAAVVTMNNPRFLNAEDESTLEPLETAIDLALLDSKSEICVLRGGPVSHPKHAGKRLFGAGINLTHLYHGKIRYLWFMLRDMGLVNKLYRGVAFPDVPPEEGGREKVWIAAVEGFAIGGHCQRDRSRRAHGPGDREHRRAPDRLRRGERRRQPPRLPHRPGADGHFPPLHGGVRSRAGLLPLQPAAHQEPRKELECRATTRLRRSSSCTART